MKPTLEQLKRWALVEKLDNQINKAHSSGATGIVITVRETRKIIKLLEDKDERKE